MSCYADHGCIIDCKEDDGCRDSTIYGNGATTIDIQCNSDPESCEATVYCTTSICTCTAGDCEDLNLETYEPTQSPTTWPTNVPTFGPSSFPTFGPSSFSTFPTTLPTNVPSIAPTVIPTQNPSKEPTIGPTLNPTLYPTVDPILQPSYHPSYHPSAIPTYVPSIQPSANPSNNPSVQPSIIPTSYPSGYPSTVHPSINPTTDVIIDDNNPLSINNLFKSKHMLAWIVICSCIFLCCIILIIACLKKRRNKMIEDAVRLQSFFQKPTDEYPSVNNINILSLSSASSDMLVINDKNVSSDTPIKLRQISLSVVENKPQLQNMLTLETSIDIDGENNVDVDVDVDHIRFGSDHMSDIMFKVEEEVKTMGKEEEQQISNVLSINEIMITKYDDESESESTSVSIQAMDITTADGKGMIGKETVGGCSNEDSTESDDESSDGNEGCTTDNNNFSDSSKDVEKSGTKSDSDFDVVQQMETMS